MSRHAILGNGALTVGINEYGLVHDFYFPYVGLENLATSRHSHHKLGVWVDETFQWIETSAWETTVSLSDQALTSFATMKNSQLGLEMQTTDFVDPELDVFCRKLVVKNNASNAREIRLFMHQVFQISRAGRADTALYVPDGHYIFDYKGRTCLVASGMDSTGQGFDQYAVGNYGIEGKEGTFRDAEDGELSGSPVEHGGVDSVFRMRKEINAGDSQTFYYWIAAGDSQQKVEDIHNLIKKEGIEERLRSHNSYWEKWLSLANKHTSNISADYGAMVRKSLMTIKAHIDKRGGVIASADSSIYNYGRDYYSYVWPRDGAYALWPLIRLGYKEEARNFFLFCRDILTPDGYLMHKYQPDKAVGSTWHPLVHDHHRELAIQEDETAIVLYMLGEYIDKTGDTAFVADLFDTLVKPMADFLSSYVDESTALPHASYDLWEEKFLTTTYTASVTYQALVTAADIANALKINDCADKWIAASENLKNGFASFYSQDKKSYRKGFLLQTDGSLGFDDTLDISSVYGVAMFMPAQEMIDEVRNSIVALEQKLINKSPSGGLPRYEHDRYFASDPPYMGNPWFVATLWLAQLYIRLGRKDDAKKCIDWSIENALPSGVLSEQIDPSSGEPKSVTPLVWSHAELVNAILDLADRD